MVTLYEILDRVLNGPICKLRDWDMTVFRKASEKLKEHGLAGTYNPDKPVSSDDSLAKAYFKAGWELAVEMGVLCTTTERIIKISDEELKDAIRTTPSQLNAGSGADIVHYRNRKPEDKTPAVTCLGSFGHPTSEEVFIQHSQAVVNHRYVDTHVSGTLVTAYGLKIRSGTPFETLAAYYEAKLTKEAVKRAGRPNMPIYGVELSATGYGNLGGYTWGGYTPQDPCICVSPAELKTDYNLLHKLIHRINIGGISSVLMSHQASVIGGYAGGVETTAIVNVAGCLLMVAVHFGTIAAHRCLDFRTSADTGRESIWADSVVDNAVAGNTNLIVGGFAGSVAGPCTEMHLLETANVAISRTVCGCGHFMGVKATHGRYMDHSTPLESWIAAEVVKAVSGMKRDDATEIVKKLLPRYEEKLADPPIGKAFQECFDLRKLKPSEEAVKLYNGVKKELIDLGVPLL